MNMPITLVTFDELPRVRECLPGTDCPITQTNQVLDGGGLRQGWPVADKAEPGRRTRVEVRGIGDDVGEVLVQEDVVRLDTDGGMNLHGGQGRQWNMLSIAGYSESVGIGWVGPTLFRRQFRKHFLGIRSLAEVGHFQCGFKFPLRISSPSKLVIRGSEVVTADRATWILGDRALQVLNSSSVRTLLDIDPAQRICDHRIVGSPLLRFFCELQSGG